MNSIKEVELKDIKNLIDNMNENTIISVDLSTLSIGENVTNSATLKRGDDYAKN